MYSVKTAAILRTSRIAFCICRKGLSIVYKLHMIIVRVFAYNVTPVFIESFSLY